MTNWATIEEVQAAWPDAVLDETTLQRMIDACQAQLEVFAPALAYGDPIPPNYTEALILQVRELWRAGERDSDVLGVGEYVVRAKDLTAQVKALLRPRSATPRGLR